jgi:hypothetical protein
MRPIRKEIKLDRETHGISVAEVYCGYRKINSSPSYTQKQAKYQTNGVILSTLLAGYFAIFFSSKLVTYECVSGGGTWGTTQ